jgi:hypothetical protein
MEFGREEDRISAEAFRSQLQELAKAKRAEFYVTGGRGEACVAAESTGWQQTGTVLVDRGEQVLIDDHDDDYDYETLAFVDSKGLLTVKDNVGRSIGHFYPDGGPVLLCARRGAFLRFGKVNDVLDQGIHLKDAAF